MLNELAQWGVLLFLVVLTVGLLRQLGFFMYGGDQGPGPRPGSRLPRSILAGTERAQFKARIEAQSYRAGAVVFVGDDTASDDLIVELEQASSETLPLAIVTSGEILPRFADRIARVADVVRCDPEGRVMKSNEIPDLPALLWVDESLVVRHHARGERLEGRVLEWLAPPDAELEPNADPAASGGQRRERVEVT